MQNTVIEVIEQATEIVTVDSESTVSTDDSVPVVIETPIGQGPPGRDAMTVSAEANNRLQKKPDGLYVSDDFIPDPLAHYILAKG